MSLAQVHDHCPLLDKDKDKDKDKAEGSNMILMHHQCIISASSVHHKCIISASSAHHQTRPGQRRLQSRGPNSRTCVLVELV